jgi:rare lipoprotein A
MRRRAQARRRRLAAALLPALAVLTITTADSTGAQEADGSPRMNPNKHTVTYGGKVSLRGRFPDAPRQRVEIHMQRRGEETWKLKTETRTDGSGRFSKRVGPAFSASWRAELAPVDAGDGEVPPAAAPADRTTGGKLVKVRSVTKAKVSSHDIVRGRSVRISGRVQPDGQKRAVVIRAGGKRLRTTANSNGRFSRKWSPGLGTHRIRVRADGNTMAKGSQDGAGTVQVFRPVQASYYGPGFYGGRTACGQTLTTSTQGVAHRSLPCGTRVTLRYHGREVTVPVIDRGPYAAGREYDLTSATKNRLGSGSTGTVLSSR